MIELNKTYTGKCSWFGGARDEGMSWIEGLALIEMIEDHPEFFEEKAGHAFGRLLDPSTFYCACRWDYEITPKSLLRQCKVKINRLESNKSVIATPLDWGPAESTGRLIDVSPGVLAALKIKTDDIVEIELFKL